MAETTNKKNNPEAKEAPKAAKADAISKIDIAPQLPNLLEGFTKEEIAALVQAKEAIEKGRYSDVTNEHRKLLFVRWLVDHDKLGS